MALSGSSYRCAGCSQPIPCVQTPQAAITQLSSIPLGISLLQTRVSDLCPARVLWAGFTALPHLCAAAVPSLPVAPWPLWDLAAQSEGEDVSERAPELLESLDNTLGDDPVQGLSDLCRSLPTQLFLYDSMTFCLLVHHCLPHLPTTQTSLSGHKFLLPAAPPAFSPPLCTCSCLLHQPG